jgi:hypothetical protein
MFIVVVVNLRAGWKIDADKFRYKQDIRWTKDNAQILDRKGAEDAVASSLSR